MVGISWGRKGMMYLPSINSHSSDTQSFQGSRTTFWWTIDNCRFWSSENVCYRKRSDFNWNKIFRMHWPDCIYIFKDGNIEERSTGLRIYSKHPITLGMVQKGPNKGKQWYSTSGSEYGSLFSGFSPSVQGLGRRFVDEAEKNFESSCKGGWKSVFFWGVEECSKTKESSGGAQSGFGHGHLASSALCNLISSPQVAPR